MLHRSVGPPGIGAGPRCNAMCFRRRTRIRTCKPSHALPIDLPAFAAQHHPDAQVAKAWSRGSIRLRNVSTKRIKPIRTLLHVGVERACSGRHQNLVCVGELAGPESINRIAELNLPGAATCLPLATSAESAEKRRAHRVF
jgi:hypothetical protein